MESSSSERFEKFFSQCKTCEGKNSSCKMCHGIGVGLLFGKDFFFIEENFDKGAVLARRIRKKIFQIVNFCLGFIAFGGLVSLVWAIFEESSFLFWRLPHIGVSLFYGTLFIDTYVYARLRRHFLGHELSLLSLIQLTDGVLIKKMSKNRVFPQKHSHDITSSFSPHVLSLLEKGVKNQNVNAWFFANLLSDGEVNILLARLGVSQKSLLNSSQKIFRKPVLPQDIHSEFLLFRRILLRAFFEALTNGRKEVGILELFLALSLEDAMIHEILYAQEIDEEKIRHVTQWISFQNELLFRYKKFRTSAKLRPKGAMDRAMTAVATPFLDAISEDLTRRAQMGYTDLIVGREKELEAAFRAMESGKKSIILVGNPGVGKEALIFGIAERMVQENVPKLFFDKRLVRISSSRLIAGAGAAEVQGRLQGVIEEVMRARNIILVVEDIEDLIGITVGEQESLDLSEILARPAANSSILLIATATEKNYRSFVEGSFLGTVLTKLIVDEPNVSNTMTILESKAPMIEYDEKIFFSFSAIKAATLFAKRYLREQFLPENAISLLREGAIYAKKNRGEKTFVTQEDIAQIVSERTGIPLVRVTQKESAVLLQLEDKIHEYMIDQEEAVKAVARGLRRARAELRDENRPIVNLLFLGPTGVGKTELAKTVAKIYFGGESEMIRLDMSEYQDKGSIYRMIGAPPGSVSTNEGGFLTQAVRRNPFSLLLLDEIEKAHPDILNLFLQVMDDGRLTDSDGRTIDFTNVILIATSNAGTQFIQDQLHSGILLSQIKEELMNEKLKEYFHPEFLNRFDALVIFHPLNISDVQAIAKLFLKKVSQRLEEKGIGLQVTDQAISEIAQKGFDQKFGARPLRRVIQEHIDDTLARFILSKELNRRDTVIIEGLDQIKIEKAPSL